MREEYATYLLWLLIVGSWVFGFAYGKWFGAAQATGAGDAFGQLSRAVSVPEPLALKGLEPLLYFPLTLIAAYVLSQLFFGVGAVIFVFSRGVGDSALFLHLEATVKAWDITTVSSGQLWNIFFVILVLTINLPLFLWAAHLGTKRSIRMFHRLRGKPLRPEAGLVSGLALLLAISLVLGLIGTLAISYAHQAATVISPIA
jgi:hypothetical protein